MRVIATGFNTGEAEGSVATFAERLEHLAQIGCTGAEVSATGMDLVVACRLIPHQVAAARAAMQRHPLAYSMHAPIAINLMDRAHADLHRRAAFVSMDLAAEIGAQVVVLHPGRCHPRDWLGGRDSLLSYERDELSRLADHAAAQGVTIAYENISPNDRVIAGEETSYSLDPAALARQIAAVAHPALIACLDISHAQQGAGLLGFDMLTACAALAPHVGHIHYSDSTGIPATIATKSQGERHFFGVGDMHAPPGMGAVDFAALAATLAPLMRDDTRIVIEVKRNFKAHAEAATLAAAQAFAARLNGDIQ
ncbi:MAG: sugar phosphate isomerase/epimerase [Rhodobacteraceae bacterium]|nr:sugar phosphate isomerase/epimerase [Paracoccaceae bacterium]